MKKILLITSGLAILVLILLASYSSWNAAAPAKTCASCHEITHSFDLWAQSAHRNIACKECHGTALSEGLHSLKEKAGMLFHHKSSLNAEDIKMSEAQRLQVMERCIGCHQTEFAKWNSGGHAMNYADIFLNTKHNKSETPHDDCLRCHGMFFDKGTVKNIIDNPDSTGNTKFKDPGLAARTAIPCMACHQIHQAGFPGMRQDLNNPSALHFLRVQKSFTSFYYRRDSSYFPVARLAAPTVYSAGKQVKISDDLNQRLCFQCHSPNTFNTVGTSDDRTPRGVHEGISCVACHDAHSNSAVASCKNCHPAISNCKLNVEKMNTSYFDRNSKNNIHFVSCLDCHVNAKSRPVGKP
jgi:hypothetical protein